MSREAGQGRGASSRGRQRSPEELAAVLARLADQAGDPKPRERSGGGRRRSGSPLRPPIAEPPTQRVPDAPARVAERPAPRRAKPPEARVAEPSPVVPKPRVPSSNLARRASPSRRRVAPRPAPAIAKPPLARAASTARAAARGRSTRQRHDRRHPDQPRRPGRGSVGFRATAGGDQQQRHRRRPRHPEAPAAEHSQGAPRGPTRARPQDTRRCNAAAQPCVGPDRRPAGRRPQAADADPSRRAHVAAYPRRTGRARDFARGDHQRRLEQAPRRDDADKAGGGARGDHAGNAGLGRPDGDAGHNPADDRADDARCHTGSHGSRREQASPRRRKAHRPEQTSVRDRRRGLNRGLGQHDRSHFPGSVGAGSLLPSGAAAASAFVRISRIESRRSGAPRPPALPPQEVGLGRRNVQTDESRPALRTQAARLRTHPRLGPHGPRSGAPRL